MDVEMINDSLYVLSANSGGGNTPENYKGYSSTVSTMLGGLVGRIQGLHKEIR